jgi:signal transduction histidine kinase
VSSLFVIQGRDQGVRFELPCEGCVVGREPDCGITLHDSEVSRKHAEFVCEGEVVRLRDLGSSNGTFVNGQSVSYHSLSSGDQIQIGQTILLFTTKITEHEDLAEKIDIVLRTKEREASQIVRALGQEAGAEFLRGAPELVNPLVARARENLQLMYRTALAVSHTLDIDLLLQRLLELIFEWVQVDRGCIMLMDQKTHRIEPRAHRNREGVRDGKISISKTILDYVLSHTEGVLTSDAREDERWTPGASVVSSGVREAICVPMQGRYHMVGVIYIDTFIPPRKADTDKKLSEDHLKLMIAIGHQAALAIEDTQYYSAMVEAERLAAVGQTIAVLSHHIKNILQGIRGGSFLVDMGLNQNNDQALRKGWAIVEKNQNKISSLVMDMLTFSKEREPDVALADMNKTVADVVELIQSRADELKVELTWRPSETLPLFVFDAEGLHRAILNIVTNAIDAAAREEAVGHVHIATQMDAQADRCQITIADDGVGIPPDEIEKIFSLFVSSKGNRGTGLGLPVSQKIVREHGGQIIVRSTLNKGTIFTIELPLRQTLPTCTDGDSEIGHTTVENTTRG